jgi:hypothetical protein
MSNYEIGLELVNSKWQGASHAERENILLEMKQQGLSIMDAIRALTMSKHYSLGEAKEYVSTSPAWRVQVENGRILHKMAWQALDEFNASQRSPESS